MTSFADAKYHSELAPTGGPWFQLGDGELPCEVWVKVGATDGRPILRGLYIEEPEITGAMLRRIPVARLLSDLWEAQAEQDSVEVEIVVRPEDIDPDADPAEIARAYLHEAYQRVLSRYDEIAAGPDRARVRGLIGPLREELLTGEPAAETREVPALERFVAAYLAERARGEHGALSRAAESQGIHRVTASRWLTRAQSTGLLLPQEMPRKRRQKTSPPDAG